MLTNFGLVEFVKVARDTRAGYVYGTIGETLTEKILEAKLAQYPQRIEPYLDFIRSNYIGKITYDCGGMIKAYIWLNDDIPDTYDHNNDTSANGMFNKASIKGTIDTMSDTPGLCVRFDGHIGVYIGNGKVIEARGTKYGVVETSLKDRGWTHWLECPYITYTKTTKEGLCKGAKGEEVQLLQRQLNMFGAELVADGSFGQLTETAVKTFQQVSGLESDGIVDILTSQKLTHMILEEVEDLQTQIGKIKIVYSDLGKLLD